MGMGIQLGMVLLALLATRLRAQPTVTTEVGLPYSRSYTAKDYRALPQNWAVARDPRGLVYVGNSAGVLTYDGVQWQLIPTRNLTAARSLSVDALGQVFVGAVGDFGLLRADSVGRLRYHSLLDRVAPEDHAFADVWRCHATPEGIYFQARSHVFRYQPLTGELRTWRAEADAEFDISFAVNGRFYVRQQGRGLLQVEGDRLVVAGGGEAFALRRVFALLPTPSEQNAGTPGPALIVVTRESGLLRWQPGAAPTPIPAPVAPLLDRLRVYTAEMLPGWRMAFGTLRGGVVLTDLRGAVSQVIDKRADGLQDQSVYHVMGDGQGGVWLALNNGLARLELPSPLSLFDERLGLTGVVEAFVRHPAGPSGRLLAATNQGLVELRAGRFEPVGGSTAQGRALLSAPQGLLYGTQDTLYAAERTARGLALRGLAPYRTRVLARASADTARVWVGRLDGLASVSWQGGRWRDEGAVSGVEQEVSSIAEGEGELWLGSPGQGVLRVRFEGPGRVSPRVERYGTESGLPPGDVVVYRALGAVRFQTVDGTYRYAAGANAFVPDTALAGLFALEGGARLTAIDYVTELSGGRVWVSADGQRYQGARRPDGRYTLQPALALRRVTEAIGAVEYFEADGTVWLGGFDGAVRYAPAVYRHYTAPFRTVIRSVQLGADSLLYGGADSLPPPPALDYGFGLLRISYAGLSYDNAAGNLYQTRLEGIDREWSPWSPDTRKDYTYLPEGDYTFRVRARNVYGTRAQEASYRFTVRPPWARTWWGLSLITLAGLGVVVGLVRWRVARLRREKDVLEQRVTERTQQITQQNQALELAYREIEEKNQDITDSIQYASRIQQALLPQEVELARAFPDHFVFYQPRDIVSGDFYWLSKKDEALILAICDCTGHGVPGALMSMMGNTLFNQIVNERGVTDPPAVLDELDQRIRALLRQGQSGTAYDGMEVTMILWLPATREAVYSGAYLPLFVGRGGSIEELPPTKRGIGGRLDAVVPFEPHRLRLEPGDRLYFTTDGLGDQFGGPQRRKFMTRQLRELLQRHLSEPMPEQGRRVEAALKAWQGDIEQLDDILVVGVRLP